jgi:hypothetical protein
MALALLVFSEQSVRGAALAHDRDAPVSRWVRLLDQADRLRLPTRFLHAIPADFILVEFADLQTFAAEYHPDTHRMVLNRGLSFNAAGGMLRPLAEMNHRDVATLYHELFHAYLDYVDSALSTHPKNAVDQHLLAFAKDRQRCRYTAVSITPLRQKKDVVEERFLTEQESWEALNETWAVFVGWVVWTKLEGAGSIKSGKAPGRFMRSYLAKALKKADQAGELTGYYEPEDPRERGIARKRYLAPSNRITRSEVAMLLENIFEETPENARALADAVAQEPASFPEGEGCLVK